MNVKESIEELITGGVIPSDSEVVSTNNKVVVVSASKGTVSRIIDLSLMQPRDDPQDIRYSHSVSWLGGADAPIVRPTHETPLTRGSYVISTYPLMKREGVDLSEPNAKNIYDLIMNVGDALPNILLGMPLRGLSVPIYVQERLDYLSKIPTAISEFVDFTFQALERLSSSHPFSQLSEDDIALVHGDYKSENVVADEEGGLMVIDLDAASIGPRLFDIASWRLRCELGDGAPIEKVADVGRKTKAWDEESYLALIGWKAISSMSFTLRYEHPSISKPKFKKIARAAMNLGGI
jgi:serine/threonine protein kinase